MNIRIATAHARPSSLTVNPLRLATSGRAEQSSGLIPTYTKKGVFYIPVLSTSPSATVTTCMLLSFFLFFSFGNSSRRQQAVCSMTALYTLFRSFPFCNRWPVCPPTAWALSRVGFAAGTLEGRRQLARGAPDAENEPTAHLVHGNRSRTW